MSDEIKWDKLYLIRLASIYIDKYEKDGHLAAKDWYTGFLPKELRAAVRPVVAEELARRTKENKKK